MNKYLPEEIVDMLLEEWGKEEDEDTPTETCRCISLSNSSLLRK